MGTKEYTKIESVNVRKHHAKTEESDNIPPFRHLKKEGKLF